MDPTTRNSLWLTRRIPSSLDCTVELLHFHTRTSFQTPLSGEEAVRGQQTRRPGRPTHLEAQAVLLLPEAEVRDLLVPEFVGLHHAHQRHLGGDHVLSKNGSDPASERRTGRQHKHTRAGGGQSKRRWYLQHEHHGLHGVPLGLPSVHDDGEAAGLALLTAWRVSGRGWEG